ncbi:WhiB family transcriptional regulator [Streptomyces sp. ISBFB 2968]|uniref:WhiB family transcriptional regulator n=1 Tax=Streptomyces sp. ISBFB 2968 TaxID=2903527 RepID=UPI003FA793F4
MTPNTRHPRTLGTATPEQRILTFLAAGLAPADTGNWRDDAECRRHDPDLWFAVGHTPGWQQKTEEAITICGRCPVRPQCLEWALSTDQRSGVWGGLTEQERRAVARDRIDRGRSYELCIDAQEYIEQRLAAGATHRVIADELGVGHSAVGRACRFFESERAAQAAGQEVAA